MSDRYVGLIKSVSTAKELGGGDFKASLKGEDGEYYSMFWTEKEVNTFINTCTDYLENGVTVEFEYATKGKYRNILGTIKEKNTGAETGGKPPTIPLPKNKPPSGAPPDAPKNQTATIRITSIQEASGEMIITAKVRVSDKAWGWLRLGEATLTQ